VPQAAAGGAAADAGLSGASLVARLSGLYDLRVHTFDPAADPNATLPDFARVHRAGTPVVFASTSRLRIGAPLKAFVAAIRPTLHLALWNAYNVLDVDAPALVTYGFRPEALDAVVAWMQGRAQANGTLPIALT